ncbi:MAG TPA: ParB N-terminal domain-containing protein [Ilumatobacteraceae bacterium]
MIALHGTNGDTETTMQVDALRAGPSPREGLNLRHVGTLAELDGSWEPILVNRRTMEVIDGRHRLAAAKNLGHRTIAVTFFDGSDAEARLEAVRVNVRHGLPLTLSERNSAARNLLALFPSWSDRQMGGLCALSPRTIARIRSEQPAPEATIVSFPSGVTDKRLGKDGRQYPVAAGAQRIEIRRVLEEDPHASLRSVAARTGASPETVRSVRKAMCVPEQPIMFTLPARVQLDAAPEPRWSADSACSSTAESREFAQWFDDHQLDAQMARQMADAIPLSRVYGVIDEARRRAGIWENFAKTLQGRVCRRV